MMSLATSRCNRSMFSGISLHGEARVTSRVGHSPGVEWVLKEVALVQLPTQYHFGIPVVDVCCENK